MNGTYMAILDLHHWLTVDRLSLREASLLILGADPHDYVPLTTGVVARAKTIEKAIFQALDRAHEFACEYLADDGVEKDPQLPDIWECSGTGPYLVTLELRNGVGCALENPETATLLSAADSSFSATVNGGDFQKWLDAREIYSAFGFRGDQLLLLRPAGQETSRTEDEAFPLNTERLGLEAGRWPWGSHETKLLDDLAAAAGEWSVTLTRPTTPLHRQTRKCRHGW